MNHNLRFSALLLLVFCLLQNAFAVDLAQCSIVYSNKDAQLVGKMAVVLSEDIERVCGVRPEVICKENERRIYNGSTVLLATVDCLNDFGKDIKADELKGEWERYKIVTKGNKIVIVGSDARGLAYGVLHVSETIGVNPWYWMADVPVVKREKIDFKTNFASKSPSVKFRGFFINDEDWGLKTWAANNFEKELSDIGPKTYDKVCELILRLKGNMLAPAMHSCTGAFYTHPKSQEVAASWGIMITTSHCEPLLFNNASKKEWDSDIDGEWNFMSNRDRIYAKLDGRIRETAQFDNIYTIGLRGLHDAAMVAPKDVKVRIGILEKVFADEREILERNKKKSASQIPQIFVPYKEALDIYNSGLNVPDDVTLVWPDDNYGYMKRVSNMEEQKRSGRSGLYYHISYLGTPHDNLWIATTAPALMYEELRKAYDAGADRYWLLNVGDIKPMEIETSQFFKMAWDIDAFSYENVNKFQAQWLAEIFGKQYQNRFKNILDNYYRLAWQRKPEFMGYEMEWDTPENSRLHDTDFSFESSETEGGWGRGSAERRLADYERIANEALLIYNELPEEMRPAYFEMLGYSVLSANQMNRKFLYAQLNHETGSSEAASLSRYAADSIQSLLREYNSLLNGKWNQMMSQLPPGLRAKYQLMPDYSDTPTKDYILPEELVKPRFATKIDLSSLKPKSPFRLIEGLGMDWVVLQMGNPFDKPYDSESTSAPRIEIPIPADVCNGDSVNVNISVVPVWPVDKQNSNRLAVSLDGCKPVILENKFQEWGFSWKLQVLENRFDFYINLPVDKYSKNHTLSLIQVDGGQMVQGISLK